MSMLNSIIRISKYFITGRLFLSCFFILFSLNMGYTAPVEFSEREKAWISSHPDIVVGAETDWPPFDFVFNGKATGFSNDYIRLLAEKAGLNIRFVHGFTWAELQDMAKDKKIDILPLITKTRDRELFLNFTESYYSNKYSLIVKQNEDKIQTIDDLSGKRLALINGHSINETILEKYPDINIFYVNSALEGLLAVSDGKAEGFIEYLPVANYIRAENLITDLRVAEINTMPDAIMMNQVGVRKDWPLLKKILEKAMSSVTIQEYDFLKRRWFGMEQTGSNEFFLTSLQKEWLGNLGTIRVGIADSWAPFEFEYGDSGPQGISLEYIKIIKEKLGIDVEIKAGEWHDIMDMAEAGEIDLLPLLNKTQHRSKFLSYSDSYLTVPMIIATKTDAPFYSGISDMSDITVGIGEGYAVQAKLLKEHPEITTRGYSTIEKALLALDSGKISAVIANSAVFSYYQKKLGLQHSIQINNTIPFEDNLAVGLRHELEPMIPMLNSILKNIPPESHKLIMDKWTNLPVHKVTDWDIIWQVSSISIVFIILIIIWNIRISREVKRRVRGEKLLSKSNELLKRAQALGHVGHWEYDPVNDVISGSDEYYRIFGTSAENHITFHDFIGSVHYEDSSYVNKKVYETMKNRKPYIADYRIVISNSSIRHVHVQADMTYDENNLPVHMFGSIVDVTELKSAQLEVLESEKRLQLALDGANAGLFYYDPVKDKIVWDDRSFRIFGVNKDQFAGNFEAWKKCIYTEDLDSAVENFEAITSNKDRNSGTMEFRIQHPDGKIKTISVSLRIVRDNNNEIREVTGLHFDITERIAAQTALSKRLDAEKIISNISSRFISLDVTMKQEVIDKTLGEIGEFFEADRACVFMYNEDFSKQFCTNEWCVKGIYPHINMLQDIDVDDTSWWEKQKTANKVLEINRVADLPDEASIAKSILEKQGIKSILIAQLNNNGKHVGYICLDSVQSERVWEHEESSMLSVTADIISNALGRWEGEEEVADLVRKKETLLREINHRVKNNMAALISILHLEQDRSESGHSNLDETLTDINNRLQSLLITHQLLSKKEWNDIRLSDISRDIIQGLLSVNTTARKIDLSIEQSSIKVNSTIAHHLALVFNELATNTVKYAIKDNRENTISIKIMTDENNIIIEYHDNGPGYPEEILIGKYEKGSIGLELIHGIVQFSLDGKIELFNNNGAYTKILLPIN